MSYSDKVRASLHDWRGWLPGLLAVLALAAYLVQAFRYAHTTVSSLDEGAYLYKGLLFATGQYRPFEPYGVLTNKAPLAFLIPGYVQFIFGAGLRTGRYLAIFFGALSLIATWAAARRLTGVWAAAAAVWVIALSPVVIKIHSEGVTQSVVAFLLAVILALSLGADRPWWHLVLSGFLAGVMILVRQNMVLVLPLLAAYVWWQNGWKPAAYTVLASGLVLIFFHVRYWPHILQLWTAWLPDGIVALLPDVTPDARGLSRWDPSIDLFGRLLSFFQGVRFHFAAVAGAAVGLLLWPRRRTWKSEVEFRAAVFLAALFVGLLLMHSWASISHDYCVFCFTPYLAFFNVSGVLLILLVVRNLEPKSDALRQALLVLVVLVVCAGLGFSAFEDIGDGLLGMSVPRVRGGQILPGFTTLGELIANKYALERNPSARIVSTAAGALLGALIVLLSYGLYRRTRFAATSYAPALALSVLVLGGLFSPILGGSAARPDCNIDVIASTEQVGAYLARSIPPGSQAYWNGGLSVAPLLYAPGIRIYLPQINNGYSRYIGGDTQELLRYGYWNDEIDRVWLAEADYIIVEGWRYAGMRELLPASVFDELPRSPTQVSCLEGSGLRIFRRK